MRRWFSLLMLLLGCTPALAAISVTNLVDVDLGTWDPSVGPISGQVDFCVESTSGASGNARDYEAQLDQFAATTPFELIELGDPTATITMTSTFEDLWNPGTETLTPGVPTARDKTGATACPGNINASFAFSLTVADLSQAVAGSYRAAFSATFRNTNGSGVTSATFNVDLVIPELIRISDLDDIDLGTYDGSNDLLITDAVCVYRNNPLGTYTITATSGAGAFELDGGADIVPYLVEYDDTSGFTTLTHANPEAMANADTVLTDCGGTPAATLRLSTLAADMSVVAPGLYSDTLTLTVAPL